MQTTGTRIFLLYLLTSGFFLSSLHLNAQDVSETAIDEWISDLDQAYGVDYNLVNGKKYVYFYAAAAGHPFLSSHEFTPGWVKIKGIQYKEILLNYDIYNQEVIAEYQSELLGTQRYIVPYFNLEEFGKEGRTFIKLETKNVAERIYEVISDGKYKVLFSHDKQYTIDRNASGKGYIFSNEIVRRYLKINDELLSFHNNRSFRKLFPHQIQGEIKEIMKQGKINVRKASNEQIKQLMEYINSL